jgi:hypothetical protein
MSALELVAFDVVPLWTALIKTIVVLSFVCVVAEAMRR